MESKTAILDTEFSARARAPRRGIVSRLLGTTPGNLAFWGALAILAVVTLLLARTVLRHGAFIGDDLVGFWAARTWTLSRFLAKPIDVHFVPVHRLVTYVVFRLAPLQFWLGLGVLLLLHGTALLVLFRAASSVSSRSIAAVLVCLYGLNPSLGSLLIWWTSGLHRLGCVAFVAVALFGYVKYRSSANARWLLAMTLATAVALGFYSKAVLIPAYVALVELNFVATLGRRFELRRLLPALGATIATVGVYVALWYLGTEAQNHAITFDPEMLALFAVHGLRIFGPLVFGSWVGLDSSVALGSSALWFLLLLITSIASPRALVAWASLILGLGLNTALISLAAAKTRLYGASVLLSDRYYFEQAFLLVVFGAFALQSGRDHVERWLPARRGRVALVAVALSGLLLLSARSRDTFRGLRKTVYLDSNAAAHYMTNLRADLVEIPAAERRPLSLVDSPVSRSLIPFGDIVNFNSQLLSLMGETVHVQAGGAYRVNDDGHIVSLVPRERPRY